MSAVQYVLRYVELFVAFASLYWWAQGGGTEAVVVLVGALGAFIGQDIFWSIRSEELKRNREKDKALFDELRKLLDAEFLYFLRNHDQGDASRESTTQGMMKFVDLWKDAEHEFLDSQLERLRKNLHQITNEYASSFVRYTYGGRNGFRKLSDELFYRDEKAWRAQQKELNDLADKVADALETLIRSGRRKL